MTTSEIEALLEKYFEGNTSLQEENVLSDFFNGADVPLHLKQYQAMFTFFSQERLVEMGGEVASDFRPESTSGEDETPVYRILPVRRKFIYATAIAASFLLLVGLVFTIRHDVSNRKLFHPENPAAEIALLDAREALLLVSGNLNYGLQQAEKLQTVEKVFHEFEYFNKFYQYQPININQDNK